MKLGKAETAFIEIAGAAAALALTHFRPGLTTHAKVQYKNGSSPVTAADFAVDDYLKQHLPPLFPDAGWLSEETEDGPARLSRQRVLVVDPIDGTRAFIAGDGRWAVSVALVEQGEPVLAALIAPAIQQCFVAARGKGATLNGVALPKAPLQRPAIAAGPVLLLDKLQKHGIAPNRVPKIPSLAYRLALVASNELDLALATSNAHDWDIAAADLILRESGARLTGLDDHPPCYNRVDTRHSALVAARNPLHKTAITALAADAT